MKISFNEYTDRELQQMISRAAITADRYARKGSSAKRAYSDMQKLKKRLRLRHRNKQMACYIAYLYSLKKIKIQA